MTRLILVADHVVVGDAAGTVLSPGVVTVEDGIIVDVARLTGVRPRGAGVVDLGESVLMPGLVNAHAHAPMQLLRGVSEGYSLLTWEGWLGAIRSREEHLTPDLLPAATRVACAEMIGSGTTSFADQYLFAEAYLPAIAESGLRASVAYGVVDLGDDERVASSLAAAESFVAREQAHPLVQGWVGPHAFFVDNRFETIEAELGIARRYGAGLHAHFATSTEEDDVCLERYGCSAIEQLRRMGVLEVPTILAHANELRLDDLPPLAGTAATVAVAPSVAMISGASAPPVRAALDAGVNVAIGTDNLCGNNNADMFEEMRTLGKLAAFTEKTPNVITSRELIEMATWRGRRAMGGSIHDGRVEAGGIADLVALPIGALHRGPVGAQSIHSAIVYGASGFDTTDVITAGRFLKRDGVLTTVDLDDQLTRRQHDFDTLAGRIGAA
jgi:5-methylthioadenosine/S-adenosylhomocysteine deaminase